MFVYIQAELELVQKKSRDAGAFDAVICSHWARGGIYKILTSTTKISC